jgi:hypothetical protein
MFITEKTGMLRTSHTAHVLHTIRSNTTPSEFGTQGQGSKVKGQQGDLPKTGEIHPALPSQLSNPIFYYF